MRILNPNIERDLAAGTGLRLNLGCGRRPRPGYYNVDLVPLPGVDIVADLNEPMRALPDSSVTEIYSEHTLEHVTQLLPLLAEIHRVARPGARVTLIMPHFSNPYAYSDPTHVRFFGLYTFYYFCDTADQPPRKVPNFYMAERFAVESVKFLLLKRSLLERGVGALLQWAANLSIGTLDCYERRLCWLFPVASVRYLLRVKKPGAAAAA